MNDWEDANTIGTGDAIYIPNLGTFEEINFNRMADLKKVRTTPPWRELKDKSSHEAAAIIFR